MTIGADISDAEIVVIAVGFDDEDNEEVLINAIIRDFIIPGVREMYPDLEIKIIK